MTTLLLLSKDFYQPLCAILAVRGEVPLLTAKWFAVYAGTFTVTFEQRQRVSSWDLATLSIEHFFSFWSNTSGNAQLTHLPSKIDVHYAESCLFCPLSKCGLITKFLAHLSHNQASCNPQISQQEYRSIKYLSDWGQKQTKNLIGLYCQGYLGDLLTINC